MAQYCGHSRNTCGCHARYQWPCSFALGRRLSAKGGGSKGIGVTCNVNIYLRSYLRCIFIRPACCGSQVRFSRFTDKSLQQCNSSSTPVYVCLMLLLFTIKMLSLSTLVMSCRVATVPCLQGEAYPRLFQHNPAYHGRHYYDLCAAVSVFWSCAVIQQSCSPTSPTPTKPSLDAKHVDP